MASFYESMEFEGMSDLPRGWYDDFFHCCSFSKLDVEGMAFSGLLSGCSVSDSSWYWGLFNVARFIEVKFDNCLFRGSTFAGCLFVKCCFENCKFAKDNLDASCRFDDCSWYDCEQTGCEGLPRKFATEIKRRKQ